MNVSVTTYARAGLIGNPSDAFFGKTIGISVRNFSATVDISECDRLSIVSPSGAVEEFASLSELIETIDAQGYEGESKLMKATIRRFFRERNATCRSFQLDYRSDIPERLGLAGSSALIVAALRALSEFYEAPIPKQEMATVALEVETEELGISGGYLDRVVQVYEGCVYMDLERTIVEARGYGEYEVIDPKLLPNLFIAYRADLAEGSEVVHDRWRERWLNGDADVVDAMKTFGEYAEEARRLILAGEGHAIGPLMDTNFDLRRSICTISAGNIELIECAREQGAHCKFAGSGGAIIGIYEDEEMFSRLKTALERIRAEVIVPVVGVARID